MADGKSRKILVTGGAGYIGSHTCKALAAAGLEPVVFDNLVYGHEHAVQWGPLIKGELEDGDLLRRVMDEHKPEAVVHFAAYAYVGESVSDPRKYYRNNVAGSQSLIDAMLDTGISNLVFSSTCATYGQPEELPIVETTRQEPINPYGRTKLIIEQMLSDYANAFDLNYVALRYFNACGADAEGEIGEEHDPETHLIPRALMAVAGEIPHLGLYGTDYPTPDGTCIRDYIHVTDLAHGHVLALDYLAKGGDSACINLGTGQGISVREIIAAAERATGKPVPLEITPRRAGDPPYLYADATKARELLGFEAHHSSVDNIMETAWTFYQKAAVRRI